ncbi:polysaccharide biosynthesis/export family protein [Bradyrhizobium ivorense]|uniref:polysaccharide biosynthesis/export family protein n=1 Tax=Bradyrhizobium ivorense TaxID=2511166 RepID=UPI0010BA1F36|nr:polysaccharide biosynthesis/export family protein [Bradyrhizobium ivorense]VIO72033.1 Polysialic acid transport protein KpsD [Bradyrhizobium ivorense]
MLLVFALHISSIDLAAAQPAAPKAYRINTGDKIAVNVFGQPDLSGEATVDQSGKIRLPLIGDVQAANLTLTEIEASITKALAPDYIRNPTVNARIAEYAPIYVLGLVRTPGLYPYRDGLSVLGAIARAGGIGASEAQQGAALGALLQAEEKLRLLEVSRIVLLARRARLTALQNDQEQIDFREMSAITFDPARIAQIQDSEQLAFAAERQALRQETSALEQQLPRLEAEIASLKRQTELEQKQRGLNREMMADYEQLAKSGLARKSTYIEVRREEARIEGNVGRLESDTLKAELQIGEVQFKIVELRNVYHRRVQTELRDTEKSLLELSVSHPAAHRLRAAYARQAGMLTADQTPQAAITVIRASGTTNVKHEAALDFLLQPGDIVQIGSLFPTTSELSPEGTAEQAPDAALRSRKGSTAAGVASQPAAETN